jgi:hypothetical protein
MLAPVVINATSRVGAQVFLEGSRFSIRESFVGPKTKPANDPISVVPEPMMPRAAVG